MQHFPRRHYLLNLSFVADDVDIERQPHHGRERTYEPGDHCSHSCVSAAILCQAANSPEIQWERQRNRSLFGGDRLLQLTWRENTCFAWDVATFAPQGTFSFVGEGWGLTHDGRRLIMSDGTSSLRSLDPETFENWSTTMQ